jgi:hypothetical protein
MRGLKNYLILSGLILLAIYLFFTTNNQELPTLLVPLDNTNLVKNNNSAIEGIDDNGSLLAVKSNDILDARKRSILQHHYKIDQYYDYMCEYHAAASYISVDISYPQVKLLNAKEIENKINSKLKDLSFQNTIKESTTYEIISVVKYFQDNLLSVVFKGKSMHCDDRHPYTWYSTVNFNLENAHQYKIDDIFNKVTLSHLRLKIKEYFLQNYPNDIENLNLDQLDLLDDFTLNEQVITVYFDMYQLGAGYFDSIKVSIPLSQLDINKDVSNE